MLFRSVEGVVVKLIEDGIYVEEGDIVAVIEVTDMETEYDELLTNLENRRAHLSKTKVDLEMQYNLLEAQVQNNEAETEIARLDSLQIQFLTPGQKKIKELELQKVAIDKQRLEKKLSSLSVIQQSDLRRIELEIQRLENRVKSLKGQIDDLTLRASKKGLAIRGISFLTGTKFQVGDPIWSGMTVVSIPDMYEMKVKINAPEADYKLISINDSVLFTFDAMPGNIAFGKITQKSPVGQQYSENSKIKYFEIEASIDSVLTMPDPGLTAKCKIILTQVKDTIVVPQITINDVDSMKIVYVKNGKSYEERQIEIGLVSQKEAIISAGLNRGEVISLMKPDASLIKKRILLPEKIAEEIPDTIQTQSINNNFEEKDTNHEEK